MRRIQQVVWQKSRVAGKIQHQFFNSTNADFNFLFYNLAN
jgi:hypothetical protein